MLESRNRVISLRFDEDEYECIKEYAKRAGMSVSKYVRCCTLEIPVMSKADVMMFSCLRRTIGLMKHVHKMTNGIYKEHTANVIRAASACADAVMRLKPMEVKEAAAV